MLDNQGSYFIIPVFALMLACLGGFPSIAD